MFLKVISFTEELFDSVKTQKEKYRLLHVIVEIQSSIIKRKNDCSLNIRSTNVFVLLAGGIATIVCSHEHAC